MDAKLTLKESGEPVAIISGGKYNKKIISITDNKDAEEPQINDVIDILTENYLGVKKNKRKINIEDIYKMQKLLSKKKTDNPIVREAEEKLKEHNSKVLTLEDGSIKKIPNYKKRECIYVAGMSGSGKSTWCANYMKMFNGLFPEKNIYIFSRKNEDEAFNEISNINRVIIDENIILNPLQMEMFADSLCLFDDCDILPKKLLEAIIDIQSQLLQGARYLGTYVIVTSHNLSNYNKTRVVLSECEFYVIFPRACAVQPLKKFLHTYGGFDAKEIEMIRNIPSRWVCIHATCPSYVISESSVKIFR